MNIVISKVSSDITAKICSHNNRNRKVTYTFVDAYHNICILPSQLEVCERLLKYSRDEADKKAIEKEISELPPTPPFIPFHPAPPLA
jgi:hypothetical protein